MWEENNEKKTVMSGLFWAFGERFLSQLMSVVVSIVLARLLEPDYYGIISVTTVFISLCDIFVSTGLGSSLVQKKDVDDADFNTALWLGFGIAIILYIVLFCTAPLIADYYDMPLLSPVIRVMGLRLPIGAFNTVQLACIRRNMQFKVFFMSTSLASISSGIVGIVVAVCGGGIWALVTQYMVNSIVDTCFLYKVSKWKIKLEISLRKAKEIYTFGWKVLVTNLAFTLEGDIRSLIVGKQFGSSDLAFYDQGKKYPSFLVTAVNAAIEKVMLPVFSKKQDYITEIKAMLRRSVQVSTYVLVPLLLGLMAVADTLVPLVFTEKWNPCIPYIRIFCIVYLTRPFESECSQAILAIGRSDIIMKIMIATNAVALGTVLIACFWIEKVICIAYGGVITAIFSVICYMIVANKKLGYHLHEQIFDIGAPLLMGMMMCVAIMFVKMLPLSGWCLLIIQIIVGGVIYLLLSVISRIESYKYICCNLLPLLLRRKKTR